MTYVMSKQQHKEYQKIGLKDAKILEEINRTRGLHGQFKHIVFED